MRLKTVSFLGLLLFVFSVQVYAHDFKIVGYLPYYRTDAVDPSVARYLDDLIYFNLRLNKDASLDASLLSDSGIEMVQRMKRLYGVRTQICIAGWYTAEGKYFAPVVTNDSLRFLLVQNLLDFCIKYDFDGVDYDWEHPQNETETNAYADLFEETKEAFKPYGKIVSAAVSRHHIFPKRAYDALDKVHIMAYGRAPYLSYNSAVTTAEIYLERDIPGEKLYLGTPFYGYKGEQAFTYKNIVNNFNPGPEFNYTNGITFQGIYAQERRVQYAISREMAGLMIWEIGQDSPGEKSLLKAIYNTVVEMEKLPPPESMSFSADESGTNVVLKYSPVWASEKYRIYLYNHSGTKIDSLDTEETVVAIENLKENGLYYANVVAVDGNGGFGRPSKWLAATTNKNSPNVLIVNGYDPWRKPLQLIERHAELFFNSGYRIYSAYGPEPAGSFSAENIHIVDWMTGDKGHYAPALSEADQVFIESFLAAGGKLFLSGSNVGYQQYLRGSYADKLFFISSLRSVCRSDSPENSLSQFYELKPAPGSLFEGIGTVAFDNGEFGSYNVFNPDVIDPKSFGQAGLFYSDRAGGDKAACSYFSGQFGSGPEIGSVVYLAVPFETIYPESGRRKVLDRIIDYFVEPTRVVQVADRENFFLLGNYPNPFNSGTIIRYRVAHTSDVELSVYNVAGELVERFVEKQQPPGINQFYWDASSRSTGLYFYSLVIDDVSFSGKMLHVK